MKKYLSNLIQKYPEIEECAADINLAIELMRSSINSKGKVLTCGNGGSASDAEHIVGELMKGFMHPRNLESKEIESIMQLYHETGSEIVKNLQKPIPAISLTSNMSFITAYSNDVNPEYIFAQQVYGLGNKGDVLLCLSTSGNSKNVINAAMVAKVKGVNIIGFTGKNGGILKEYADVPIKAPSLITPEIQEYHIAIYHTICAQIEEDIFHKNN
ncbi:MAG: SIS domain-containing protein [Actinobacteria bacterium]|nr:SIS domain-containing protein [Actinomycetota bacterium]